ncbi:MAG: response regulator [Proteobacteria bacterium]|nr:response regulator [Pseudomonadota bacterium]
MSGQRYRSRGEASLRRQIEAIQRRRMVQEKVVDLNDFRVLRREKLQPSILVVDDEEMIRNAMKRILENEGYKAILAEDAMALSKVLEHMHLDLILLDINLPWVNGLELCCMIKNHPNLRQVPLILISGRRTKEDVERGFEAGCDDYITKPFDIENMAHTVAKALQRNPA